MKSVLLIPVLIGLAASAHAAGKIDKSCLMVCKDEKMRKVRNEMQG
jgi:hypothetical protein